MLTGQPAFRGDSGIEVMNAILKEEPAEFSETKAKISPQLEKIVRCCLEKKPEKRFHSAHDLGFALEALSSPSSARQETAALPAVTEGTGRPRVRRREWLAWAVAGALSLVALGLIWAYFTRQLTPDARVFKTSILPPEKSSFDQIAVSPDGRHLAFTAATGGKVQLWVRALDATETRALAGTQGAGFPFWSPDSRFIGFFADDRLKKIEATGGPLQTLCEMPANPLRYGPAGVILFAADGWERAVSDLCDGGEVTRVTTPKYHARRFLIATQLFCRMATSSTALLVGRRTRVESISARSMGRSSGGCSMRPRLSSIWPQLPTTRLAAPAG
jgi:hypothetical protein